ncbi:hypothetical protein B0H14DRAFT_2567372 [Mycena olivaceomarginata]|nr:hypothetical protein B0H14DRAFT_2567372 [Mycena olivaceomarginata]
MPQLPVLRYSTVVLFVCLAPWSAIALVFALALPATIKDGLSIHEQEDVRLGTGSLPQTKKEEHEPGTISLLVAQVRKPSAPGSDNLRPRITAFFTKLVQRSVVPSMEYIPRHEYLARGWDGNSNKWRSVLWPALDGDFRAADPEETSAIWRIKCPWKEARSAN